ncbi:polyprenyl synthetase family protein [Enterococcus faecalis]|uniref:polyprenyl synthetase family protein n=1 Tax=Enterococcus faecalis TaxID=1351 RepID=UPI0018E834AF|nr:farnesyl diphosphate synthase [Enterococcus faecalis]MBJ1782905.1 polyprenyl synthetase family protein [Enterococcus faecalis]
MTNFSQQHLPLVEKVMVDFIAEYTENERLKEAMLYSIHAGGKRLRPLLVLTTVAAFQKEMETQDYQVAASLEMIHTYSLIHDDLPAMDDDDLRRGKPTNHKVFGEATAILAGDGLLTGAFQLLSLSQLGLSEKVLLMQQLAKAAGNQGMVAGQMGDIEGEKVSLTLEELAAVHEKKTGALIEFALIAGGVLANQTEEVIGLLTQFAHQYGLAFQIRDDLLDATSTEADLGKKVGRDEALNKSTYPALLGIAGAKDALTHQLAEGSAVLEKIKANVPNFSEEHLANLLTQLQLR